MFDNRTKRFVALLGLCLVAASVAATSQGISAVGGPVVVTARDSKLLVNGQPRFLFLGQASTCPTVKSVAAMTALGIDAYLAARCGTGQPPEQRIRDLDTMLQNRLWLAVRNAPEDVQQLQGLPELMDWQADSLFFAGYQVLGQCDQGQNLPSDNLLNYVRKQNHARPLVYQLALVLTGPNQPSCLKAAQLENMFAVLVLGRVSGIDFIVQALWDKNDAAYAEDPAIIREMDQLKTKVTANPCFVFGTPLPVRTNPKNPVKVGAWRYAGKMCALVVNTALSPARSTFSIAGKPRLAARSVDSFRLIKSIKGAFRPSLPASGVLWYTLTVPKK